MKLLFHINHPAQYHLFKGLINFAETKNHEVIIVAKKKDVLLKLLEIDNRQFFNISHNIEQKKSLFRFPVSYLHQYKKIKNICLEVKPDLLLGTSFVLPMISKKLKIPFLNFLEDDIQVDPIYAKLTFSNSTYIVAPNVCQVGKWKKKKIGYDGYHELAYLHPEVFKPNREIVKRYVDLQKKTFLLRFSALNTYHDLGKKGISPIMALDLVNALRKKGTVIISSEKPLSGELEQFRMDISPNEMHHLMAYCSLIIGDSQSMIVEAACLGVPSIRINDYVGRISILEELEKKYKLTQGFRNTEKDKINNSIQKLLKNENVHIEYRERKEQMLKDKINVSAFIKYLVINFPESIQDVQNKHFIQENSGGKLKSITQYKLRNNNKSIILWSSLYFAVIFILYLIPLSGNIDLQNHFLLGMRVDYMIHTLVFTPIPVMIHSHFRVRKNSISKTVLCSIIFCFLFEGIHYFVPYRALSIHDIYANLIGVGIGMLIFIILKYAFLSSEK